MRWGRMLLGVAIGGAAVLAYAGCVADTAEAPASSDASAGSDAYVETNGDARDARSIDDASSTDAASSDAGDSGLQCLALHTACAATPENANGDCCGHLRCQGTCCVPGGQPGKEPCRRDNDCCPSGGTAVICSGVDPRDASDDGGVGVCFIAATFR